MFTVRPEFGQTGIEYTVWFEVFYADPVKMGLGWERPEYANHEREVFQRIFTAGMAHGEVLRVLPGVVWTFQWFAMYYFGAIV